MGDEKPGLGKWIVFAVIGIFTIILIWILSQKAKAVVPEPDPDPNPVPIPTPPVIEPPEITTDIVDIGTDSGLSFDPCGATDRATGAWIPGARVVIKTGNYYGPVIATIITGSSGQGKALNLPDGVEFNVEGSANGYKTLRTQTGALPPGLKVPIGVPLEAM